MLSPRQWLKVMADQTVFSLRMGYPAYSSEHCLEQVETPFRCERLKSGYVPMLNKFLPACCDAAIMPIWRAKCVARVDGRRFVAFPHQSMCALHADLAICLAGFIYYHHSLTKSVRASKPSTPTMAPMGLNLFRRPRTMFWGEI